MVNKYYQSGKSIGLHVNDLSC